jgi:acyl-CoA synthetase (AMP-forming)/AMP-acid ligase II
MILRDGSPSSTGPALSLMKNWPASVAAAARRLQSQGLQPGDRVALVLDSSWQYVVSYFAVLLAGGVVVPLNPAARDRDLGSWILRADATCVIVDHSHAGLAALRAVLPPGCRVHVCGGEGDLLISSPDDIAGMSGFPRASSQSLAAILFTSGTTGAPKGVMLTQGNLGANAAAIVDSLALSADDSVMAVLPFTYAYGNSVLLSHLSCGARVVIQRGFGFPQAVVEAMVRERVTGFAGVPSTFALLLSRVRLNAFDLGSLRYVSQAGGAMPGALLAKLVSALPGKQVFVMYGQTEATARLTCMPPTQLSVRPGSVGLPLRGVQIRIRDAAGNDLPADSVGDIWASGPNIMAGYWRDPAISAEVLRDGWLKTGDVGRLDPDGFLYIVGRRSDIIKVGAHRVHPQDIEDVLAELPGVSECAVVGVGDEILGEVVKAFIVRRPEATLQEQHVKRHCLENLAAYKVPKFVQFVAQLPRTSSGKVQRSLLQNPQEMS